MMPQSNTNSQVNATFDNVYVVNLEKHPEKKYITAHHLSKHGINFEVFLATDGSRGEPFRAYEEYKKRPLGELVRYSRFNDLEKIRGKGFIESAGAVGYIYTYLRILKDAKAKGYRRILIFEDDVILHRDFDLRFASFIQSVGKDWKLLQLGASQYNWNSVIESDAEKSGYYYPRQLNTCGSFALALDSSIFDELIEAVDALECPFDHLAMGEIYERYINKCFVAFPNIVMPDVSNSNIRGGRDQYSHARKMKWVVNDFDFPLSKPSVNLLVSSSCNLKYLSSFRCENDRLFSLRLFINTTDGLRAVHNSEIINYSYNKLIPIEESPSLPEANYSLAIPLDASITEEEIVDYLAYAAGIAKINKSCLFALECNYPKISKGRASVIITTYKRPSNLAQAIKSVAEQEYLDKEIIVVCDNGESNHLNDETKAVVSRLQIEYPQVSINLILHKNNRNGAAARNTGFLASTGNYISFLDDDDVYLPGRLEKCLALLSKQEKSVGAVYCGFLGWNSPVNDNDRYKEGDLSKDLLLLDYKKHYMHTNTATYTRDAYSALNGFDESYRRHQDLEFNLRFFQQYKVRAHKECLVRLKPSKTDIDNRIYGLKLLKLKQKFLDNYQFIIERFDADTQGLIYKKQWAEVENSIKDHNEFYSLLNNELNNGVLQVCLTKLAQLSQDKKALNAKFKQALAEQSDLNAKLKQAYTDKSERGMTIIELQKRLDALNWLSCVRIRKWYSRVFTKKNEYTD